MVIFHFFGAQYGTQLSPAIKYDEKTNYNETKFKI